MLFLLLPLPLLLLLLLRLSLPLLLLPFLLLLPLLLLLLLLLPQSFGSRAGERVRGELTGGGEADGPASCMYPPRRPQRL